MIYFSCVVLSLITWIFLLQFMGNPHVVETIICLIFAIVIGLAFYSFLKDFKK